MQGLYYRYGGTGGPMIRCSLHFNWLEISLMIFIGYLLNVFFKSCGCFCDADEEKRSHSTAIITVCVSCGAAPVAFLG